MLQRPHAGLTLIALVVSGLLSLPLVYSFGQPSPQSTGVPPQGFAQDVAQLSQKLEQMKMEMADIRKELQAKTIDDAKIKVVRITKQANSGEQHYITYNAPKGWRVVGAGGFIEGGSPMPIEFNHRHTKADVTTFFRGAANGILTVIVLKVDHKTPWTITGDEIDITK